MPVAETVTTAFAIAGKPAAEPAARPSPPSPEPEA